MSHKQGKSSRKHGRGRRKASHNRYTLERRWEKNKDKRIAKQKKKEETKRKRLEARNNS